MLACAPSNSASDLILERVTKHTVVRKEQIIRLNALGRSVSTVPQELKVMYWTDQEFYEVFPSTIPDVHHCISFSKSPLAYTN